MLASMQQFGNSCTIRTGKMFPNQVQNLTFCRLTGSVSSIRHACLSICPLWHRLAMSCVSDVENTFNKTWWFRQMSLSKTSDMYTEMYKLVPHMIVTWVRFEKIGFVLLRHSYKKICYSLHLGKKSFWMLFSMQCEWSLWACSIYDNSEY